MVHCRAETVQRRVQARAGPPAKVSGERPGVCVAERWRRARHNKPRLTGREPCASRPGAWHPVAAQRLQPWLRRRVCCHRALLLASRDMRLSSLAPYECTAVVDGREGGAGSRLQHAGSLADGSAGQTRVGCSLGMQRVCKAGVMNQTLCCRQTQSCAEAGARSTLHISRLRAALALFINCGVARTRWTRSHSSTVPPKRPFRRWGFFLSHGRGLQLRPADSCGLHDPRATALPPE